MESWEDDVRRYHLEASDVVIFHYLVESYLYIIILNRLPQRCLSWAVESFLGARLLFTSGVERIISFPFSLIYFS